MTAVANPDDAEHVDGCSMWHHQGGDYDRDCPACMALCAEDQRRGRWAPHPSGASMYEAADPIGAWTRRGPGTAEVVDMSEFELGAREVICAQCWCVHRPDVDCQA